VLLRQVPAARAHHDGRHLVGEGVGLALRRGEVDPPVDGVAQVELALDHVLPQRGVGVLEVGQPDPGAGVERVDGHLAFGRSGHLDPPIGQILWSGCDLPVAITDAPRFGEKVQPSGARYLGATSGPSPQQLVSTRPEPLLQLHQEFDGRIGQDLGRAVHGRSDNLNACHGVLSDPAEG
jgi:hypothetical protein